MKNTTLGRFFRGAFGDGSGENIMTVLKHPFWLLLSPFPIAGEAKEGIGAIYQKKLGKWACGYELLAAYFWPFLNLTKTPSATHSLTQDTSICWLWPWFGAGVSQRPSSSIVASLVKKKVV